MASSVSVSSLYASCRGTGGRIIAASHGLWTLQACPARRSRCACLSTASQVSSAGAAGVAGVGLGKPRQSGVPKKSFRKQALTHPRTRKSQ